MSFTEIETGRAYEIAHIFNEQQTIGFHFQIIHRMPNRMSVEVTPSTGINLNGDRASLSNSIGIIRSLLISFNNIDFLGVT